MLLTEICELGSIYDFYGKEGKKFCKSTAWRLGRECALGELALSLSLPLPPSSLSLSLRPPPPRTLSHTHAAHTLSDSEPHVPDEAPLSPPRISSCLLSTRPASSPHPTCPLDLVCSPRLRCDPQDPFSPPPARSLSTGFDVIHKMGYMHRDIKSLNVFLTADLVAKVADFGMVRASPSGVPVPLCS